MKRQRDKVIKLNKNSECENCGNRDSNYLEVESSILIDRYSFITKKNLVECSKCGARYITCSNCGSILNRVHLALDVFQIKVKCPNCGSKNKELSKWLVDFSNRG